MSRDENGDIVPDWPQEFLGKHNKRIVEQLRSWYNDHSNKGIKMSEVYRFSKLLLEMLEFCDYDVILNPEESKFAIRRASNGMAGNEISLKSALEQLEDLPPVEYIGPGH